MRVAQYVEPLFEGIEQHKKPVVLYTYHLKRF